MWLPADIAAESAVVLGGASVAIRPKARRALRLAKPYLWESAVLLVIYAIWRQLGELPTFSTSNALSRGASLWHFERAIHLPNEATIQHWLTHVSILLRFANVYYIVFHVAPLGVFLVWMFGWHRDVYPRWRNVLAFATFVCMAIQTLPVAPPRMFPQFGFIDTGQVYGPLVYDAAGSGLAGQLAAMPSMHVLWAVLIGWATMSVGTTKWRWLGFAHATLTVYTVTVTGYHWLMDGIVGGGLVGVGVLLGLAYDTLRLRRAPDAVADPLTEPAVAQLAQ